MKGYRGLGHLIQGVVILIVLTASSTDTVGPDACAVTCFCVESSGLVDCSNKSLSVMPDIPTWVQVLTLASNSFTTIQSAIFYANKKLKILYLENNLIADIDPNAFQNLYQLETLVLKDNRLTEIESGSFHHLTELRILDLRNNQLRTIAADAFELVPRISNVNLNGNRLLCDCSTVNLYRSLLDRHGTNVLEMAQCVNYQNKLIETVVQENPDLCTDATPLVCPSCSGASSITACLKENKHEVCTPQKLACRVELLVQVSGRTTVSSSCESTSKCTVLMANNVKTCHQNDSQAAMCHLCCTSNNCVNERLLQGFSTKQDYTVEMEILLPWHDDYHDAKSDKFEELSQKVQKELNQTLEKRPRSTYAFNTITFRFWEAVTAVSSESAPYLEECARNVYTVHHVPHTAKNDFLISGNKQGISPDAYIKAVLGMSCTLPRGISVTWYRDEIYFLIKDASLNEEFSFGIDTSTFTIRGDKFCSYPIPKATEVGFISWYSQLPGYTATAKCPENPDQNATIKCLDTNYVRWDTPNTTNCNTPSIRTKALEDLTKKPVTNGTLGSIARSLANLTADVGDFKKREVSLVAEITQKCLTAPNVPVMQETAGQLIMTVNKMLAVDSETLVDAELETNASTRLVQSVERVGSKVEGSAKGVKIAQPQLGVLIAKPPTDTGLLFETIGDVANDLNTARMHIRPSGSNLPDLSGNAAAVHLPSSVLLQGQNTTNIHFAVYNSASFFIAAEIANQITPGSISRDNASRYVLNSRVVSAKVGKLDLMNLKDPVTVTLRHVNNNLSKHECVYWDYNLVGWSSEGCKVTSSRDDATTCQCNHLTNFALLLDIYGNTAKLPEIHKTVLSIISYAGCAVSATGLIVTLLTYFAFRRMLRDNPSKILVNLCVALLGIIVAFIFTTQVFVRDNFIACKLFAALTHYFLLAAMAWMSVEAFYMYIAIVRVFHTYYSRFLLKCCLIGWGLPLVAVAITVGISRENYGRQGEICWLPRIPFFAAVLGPVALTLVLNGVAFGLVINQLRQMDSRKLEKSKRSNILSRLRGAISIMVLLGLTWVFAFVAVGPGGIVFTYLFAICNSLQGLFIFVFYCLLKRDAQQAWLNCLGCARPGFASSRDTMSYSTRSEVKPKANSIKPFGDEEYTDEYSSPGYIRRKSCFGRHPDIRKVFTVSEQSDVTSTTDSSTLVEKI